MHVLQVVLLRVLDGVLYLCSVLRSAADPGITNMRFFATYLHAHYLNADVIERIDKAIKFA